VCGQELEFKTPVVVVVRPPEKRENLPQFTRKKKALVVMQHHKIEKTCQ